MRPALSSSSRSFACFAASRASFAPLLAFAAVFLYLHLFLLPATPIFLAGDEVTFLDNAQRMVLQHHLPYRDFFQFTTPGTDLVYAAAMRLLGVRAWIPNAVVLVIGTLLVWLATVIARSLMNPLDAPLPGLLFLAIAFRSALDGTHHWFSAIFVTAAIAVIVRIRTPMRLLIAGVFCGVSASFTQPHGLAVLVGIAAFVGWEATRDRVPFPARVRLLASLVAGSLTAFIVINGYFAIEAGWRRFFYDTVVFLLKHGRAYEANNFSVYLEDVPWPDVWYGVMPLASWAFIHALLPAIYLAYLLYFRTGGHGDREHGQSGLLLNVVGVSLLASIAPSPSFLRLCAVALPGFVVLGWVLMGNPVEGRPFRLATRIVIPALMIAQCLSVQIRARASYDMLEAPVGRMALLKWQAVEYQ